MKYGYLITQLASKRKIAGLLLRSEISVRVDNPNPLAPNDDVNVLPQISAINGIKDPIQAEGLLQARSSYQNSEHFVVKRNARLLPSNDYTFNTKMGFISLKRRLEDFQMLAVLLFVCAIRAPVSYIR